LLYQLGADGVIVVVLVKHQPITITAHAVAGVIAGAVGFAQFVYVCDVEVTSIGVVISTPLNA